jgi:hypothetical protein
VAAVTSCQVDGQEAEIRGTLQHVTGVEELRFGLTGPDGIEFELPTESSAVADGWAFRVRVPGVLLADTPDYRSPLATRQTFEPWLDTGAARIGLTPGPGLRSCSVVVDQRTVTFCRTMAGTFQVVENRTTPEVTSITWTGTATLRVEGLWRGREALPAEVVLGHYGSQGGPIELRVPLEQDGHRYAYEVDVAELRAIQNTRLDPDSELSPRIWHQIIAIDGLDLPQVFDRDAVPTFPAPRSLEGVRVAVVLARDDLVRLAVGG